MSLSHWISAALVVLYLFFQFFTLYRLWLFRRRRSEKPEPGLNSYPGISIITSLKGGTDDALLGLDCLARQTYPGPLEVVLVVPKNETAILQLAKQKTASWDPARFTVVWVTDYDFKANGLNPRSLKMAEGYRHSTQPWLYWHAVDSVMEDSYLQTAMNLTRGDSNRFVTSFPVVTGARSLGARLEAASINLEVTKFFIMSFVQPGAGTAYGAAFLFPREILEKSGGLDATINRLTDDVVLLNQFKRVGGRCLLSPQVTTTPQESISFHGYCKRQIRWLVIAKLYMPPVFWSAPLFWEGQVLTVIGLVLRDPIFFGLGAFVFLFRILQALMYDFLLGVAPGDWFSVVLLPIYDVLFPFFWAIALLLKKIDWAGDVMIIGRDGILQPHDRALDQ